MGTAGLWHSWVAPFTRVPRALTPPILWSFIDGLGRSVGLLGPETPGIDIEQLPEPLIVARADARIAVANLRAAALFERSLDELTGMPLETLFRVSAHDGITFELFGLRQSGEQFCAEVEAQVTGVDAPGDTVVALIRDVSAQRTGERDHRAGERRLSLALATGQIGTWEVDLQASTATWDERLHRMFGLRPGTFRGTVEAFLDLVHADDRAKMADLILRAMQEAGPFDIDFRAKLPNGTTRYMSSRADVIPDDRGRPSRVAGVCSDVTERVLAQQRLQRAYDDLERRVADRTKELDRSVQDLDDFVQIISHDLKEPLRGIYNYAHFIAEDEGAKLGEEACQKLERISYLANRMNDLVDSILQSARVGHLTVEDDVDLVAVVSDVVTTLDASLSDGNVKLQVADSLPVVACDRQRIAEVFRNLITNAVKYNDKPEKIVEIGCASVDGMPSPAFFVRDNGIGIEPAHFSSVFDMFKRLHSRDAFGGGTGAGLAIAKKIVERHGGRMWLESKVGEGSTFYFTIGHPVESVASRGNGADMHAEER